MELLTESQDVPGDVDLGADSETIAALLEGAGSERTGRHFIHEAFGLTVEGVAEHLDPSQRSERIRWNEHTLHVASIEDLIVDRPRAAEGRGSDTDDEQALLVHRTHEDRIDEDRLRKRAEEEQGVDLLDGLETAAALGG